MLKIKTCLPLLVITAILLFSGCNQTKIAVDPDDTAIKDNIQSKLFQDANLKARDIRVESQKGVITLTGTVNSDMEKLAVESLARATSGVTQVVDQLSVSVPSVSQTPVPITTTASKPERGKLKKFKTSSLNKASSDSDYQRSSNPQPPPPAPSVPMAYLKMGAAWGHAAYKGGGRVTDPALTSSNFINAVPSSISH